MDTFCSTGLQMQGPCDGARCAAVLHVRLLGVGYALCTRHTKLVTLVFELVKVMRVRSLGSSTSRTPKVQPGTETGVLPAAAWEIQKAAR